MTRTTNRINVMLADDSNYSRNIFSSEIEKTKNSRIKITGTASNGLELIKLIERKAPDIVILDLAMPVMDGYKTLLVLQERFASVKVIIFSHFCSDYYISKLLLAGANAYFSKDTLIPEVIEAIHKVFEDGYYFKEKMSKHVITTLIEEQELDRLLKENLLSDREIDVLKLICSEKEAKQIAEILNISENTIKDHKRNIKQKINSKSSIGLVKYAIKVGLVRL